MTDKPQEKAFEISDNKGFHMTFENGWTVSVQLGAGNYADNYHLPFEYFKKVNSATSNKAEFWSWNKDRSKKYPKEPKGYLTVEEVWKLMAIVRRKKNEQKK